MRSRFRRLFSVLILAGTVAVPACAFAQTQTTTYTPPGGAPLTLHILQQTKRVHADGHTTTFNLVVPPVFPASTPAPQPVPVAAPPGSTLLSYELLLFSAERFQGVPYSVLRWKDGGSEFWAISNIDFDYLSGLDEFQSSDTLYSYFMMLDDEPASSMDAATSACLAQAAAVLPANQSGWVVVSGSASADATAALNALDAFFDANKQTLVTAYQRRQAEIAAHERYLRTHPPIRQDQTINYWPIRSSMSLSGTGASH